MRLGPSFATATSSAAVLLLLLLFGSACASAVRPTVVVAEPSSTGKRAPPDRIDDGPTERVEEIWSRVHGPSHGRHAARVELVVLGSAAVPFLLGRIGHPDWVERWEVVNALGSIGDHGTTDAVIQRVVLDPNVHVRWRALWALTALRDPRAPSALERRLTTEDSFERWNTAVALAMFERESAIPILQQGLDSRDDWVRWEAVNGLGRVFDANTSSLLVPLLVDHEQRIRREAVLALGRIGDEVAVAALVTALDDADPQVRWRAAMGLERTRVPHVRAAIEDRLAVETDDGVLEHLRRALEALSGSR